MLLQLAMEFEFDMPALDPLWLSRPGLKILIKADLILFFKLRSLNSTKNSHNWSNFEMVMFGFLCQKIYLASDLLIFTKFRFTKIQKNKMI